MEHPLDEINPANGVRDALSINGVHPSREFASILNRERDRADRTGQEFSMVVYEVGTENGKLAPAQHLVSILKHRIRSTDEIGWLEDGRIGVALPHTMPEGAWKFVTNIRLAYNGSIPPPDCMVYVYPSGWISSANGDPAQKHREGKGFPSGEETDTSGKVTSRVATANPVKPIEELESQFLCRIPVWKRAIDIAGSLLAMILLTPLFLLVALLIKVVSPGPIFFRQERIGYLGRPFMLWKFRTMHVNNNADIHRKHISNAIESDTPITKLDDLNDNRIIPFGKFLRYSCLDELPQLFNVLRGDMSLIGPRPCMQFEAEKFFQWQKKRFDTLPGMSGLWQVSGKNRTTFKEMTRLDIAYTKKRTLLLDAVILLKTVPVILDQVVKRKEHVHATSRSKGLSMAERIIIEVGVLILAFIMMLNMLQK